MKRLVLFLVVLTVYSRLRAQDFDTYFEDRTLRIDYLFSGSVDKQYISMDELISLPGWAGRRHRLSEVLLEGNGEAIMTDKATGAVIYRHTFSCLFLEWLGEAEAKQLSKSFQHTVLLPFPKRETEVNICIKNARREVTASMTHRVKPDDILIHRMGEDRITPHKYLLRNGDPADCIDIAIMAEGYTREEMDTFEKDARRAVDALFDHEPFKKMKENFNVVLVQSISEDSGVSIPRKGEWRRTAVDSHFDTFYSDRYLTSNRVKKINNWLAGIPYEHIIILANSDTYGGGGVYNAFTLTTAHHKMFEPVVVHEFGHSFGGLADEYAYADAPSPLYPKDIEPWEPNITTLVDFASKWKDMVPAGTPIPTPPQAEEPEIYTVVGAYEGAGYTRKGGVYRPVTACRMRINEAPAFCPVCQRAIERLIEFYIRK
ncbi:IgA Peptidase M64 [Phocaeicola abscessus]|uniref:IgA Peptidase M64 n=1 Tax=Phocaeicola abscessus TaxID=555313 RepID=UPI0004B0B375|nr:IgA Peptidase M64 [Phocaeicola abscessus]